MEYYFLFGLIIVGPSNLVDTPVLTSISYIDELSDSIPCVYLRLVLLVWL